MVHPESLTDVFPLVDHSFKFISQDSLAMNSTTTTYGKPPYEKNAEAKLVEVNQQKGYTIDFKTEKGKTYTIVPL